MRQGNPTQKNDRLSQTANFNRRSCERWKKRLVELLKVIIAYSVFLLALTGDTTGPPEQFMLKHLKLANGNDSILPCQKGTTVADQGIG